MQHFNRAVRFAVGILVLATGAAWIQGSAAEDRAQGLASWFPRLREGMWIKVEGERTADGMLRATEIKVLYGELDEWEVESHIDSVDVVHLKLMTTLGLEVAANSKTRLDGPAGQKRITFAFFEPGDQVEIEGQWQNDGTFLAEDIDVEKSKKLHPDMRVNNRHEIRGRIDAIDAQLHRVVLVGITVLFDEDTKNKTPKVD